CQEALPILKQVLEEQKLNCYYVQTRDEERNSLLKEEEKAECFLTSCKHSDKVILERMRELSDNKKKQESFLLFLLFTIYNIAD
ncbi:MAG: hypothetical protein UDO38_08000, partial [Amedibacillus dolichus]|nr:hypothetical protein [Amedibacillus dolichus]